MSFSLAQLIRTSAGMSSRHVDYPIIKWISLPRNGKSSLEFMGELLAVTTERNSVHGGASEWKLSLYRALPDHYVFASTLRIRGADRITLHSARLFETVHDLRQFLSEGEHGMVEAPRALLEKANLLGRNGRMPASPGKGLPRLQWGEGWAWTWQLLGRNGFNFAPATATPQ